MIINSKDSFFSFVDAAEFPEITLLQLRRRRARTSIAGDGRAMSAMRRRIWSAVAKVQDMARVSWYLTIMFGILNDSISLLASTQPRRIARRRRCLCAPPPEYSTDVVGLSSNGAAAVAFFVAGKSLLIGCDGDGTAPHSKCWPYSSWQGIHIETCSPKHLLPLLLLLE